MKKTKKKVLVGALALSMVLGLGSVSYGQGLNVFKPKRAYSQDIFKDIKPSDWYYENIKDVYNRELIAGKGNKRFAPEEEVSLAETIILAVNIHSQYEDDEIPQLSGAWYRSGVSYAIDKGIIQENEFKNLDAPATRAEVAYILSNSLPLEELKNINNIKEIPDVDPSRDYGENIYKFYNSGIVRGAGIDGKFKPDTNISRGEIAALVNRLVQPNKREKFGLGDIAYTNKNYGFTMTLPRSWYGHYKIVEETTNDGKNHVNCYMVKDGENLIELFSIEMVPEKDFNHGESLSRYNAGKNKGYMMLIDHSKSPNNTLERSENKVEKEIYEKMMEEYKAVRNSMKFK